MSNYEGVLRAPTWILMLTIDLISHCGEGARGTPYAKS